jgi:hypothetical protein
MKQTATDWMFDQLWETPKDKLAWFKILMDAKQINEQQIKEAYKCGACDLEIQYSPVGEINSQQYYNETYGEK